MQSIETTISIVVRTYEVAQGKPVPLPFPTCVHVRAHTVYLIPSSRLLPLHSYQGVVTFQTYMSLLPFSDLPRSGTFTDETHTRNINPFPNQTRGVPKIRHTRAQAWTFFTVVYSSQHVNLRPLTTRRNNGYKTNVLLNPRARLSPSPLTQVTRRKQTRSIYRNDR